ncbi:uncharacterized protein LOC108681861 [Hyalella azteca]|uniref:Uncharacterized protein LOC108681861 n=1 Tax=Hyalella azteca TaxID=294128 RepID=A0A8B7PKB6_HYAAZ|nr:uncharacterized protein LOC108681861 [Hyalella azteca]XP_047735681.1 uncharacterized protein LOC108681861 [Hyalella azteca]XP_047735682.1 uncharacterized protein LOC108681861 [Hyalella azteca]XP_047735683.1 uncharacterized protein LOC108681861 [Hyalella azteca]XP_047735684.1 uncharacterized protein LOC108681861 [Hyalella azteca]
MNFDPLLLNILFMDPETLTKHSELGWKREETKSAQLAPEEDEVVPKKSNKRRFHEDIEKNKFDATSFDATKFDATKFDASKFDATKFDTNKFDATKFDATKFDTNKFDSTKFDATKFDINKLEATKFDATKFDINKFDATKFDATKFDATKFDINKFDATKFDATKFDASKCESTELNATKFNSFFPLSFPSFNRDRGMGYQHSEETFPSKKISDNRCLRLPLSSSGNSEMPPMIFPNFNQARSGQSRFSVVKTENVTPNYRPILPALPFHNFHPLFPSWLGEGFPPLLLPPVNATSDSSLVSNVVQCDTKVGESEVQKPDNLMQKHVNLTYIAASPSSPVSVDGSDVTSDDATEAKRKRNNEAAKKSRDARREKEDRIAIKTVVLQLENSKLREQYELLYHEYQRKKKIIESLNLR